MREREREEPLTIAHRCLRHAGYLLAGTYVARAVALLTEIARPELFGERHCEPPDDSLPLQVPSCSRVCGWGLAQLFI